MTELPRPFELVEFEQVDAAPDTVLLRIAARPSQAAQDGPWTLILKAGPRVHRHEQLPAIPGPPGMIRAAFSAPAEQFVLGTQFELEFADGSNLQLPSPSRRRPFAPAARPLPVAVEPQPGIDGNDARLIEAERRAESRRLAVAELERRLQAESERRAATEADLASVRADRDAAREEREEAIADRREAIADRDQAEARARAAAASAGSFEAQVKAAVEEGSRTSQRLESELADRVAELERVRSAAELANARAHASRRELTALDEQMAHANAQISVLQEALAARTTEVDGLTAQATQAASAAGEQAAAAQERAAEMETQIRSLRELAERTEAQHKVDLGTAQARMDVAHAELEVARAEQSALRSQAARLESTIADMDRALAMREAEIDLLRAGVVEARETSAAQVTEQARVIAQEQIELRLADARSEASTALVAEIEVLRAQLGDLQDQLHAEKTAAAESQRRTAAAEVALAARSQELDRFGQQAKQQVDEFSRNREELTAALADAQEQTRAERRRGEETTKELRRIRDAAALVAAELMNASDAVTQARTEAAGYQQRAGELQSALASAEQTLNEAKQTVAAHEAENRRLTQALKDEEQQRRRAEDELLDAAAQRALEKDFLELIDRAD